MHYVQGGWGGWPTGNGNKLSNSPACCLTQLCLAAVYILYISCRPSTPSALYKVRKDMRRFASNPRCEFFFGKVFNSSKTCCYTGARLSAYCPKKVDFTSASGLTMHPGYNRDQLKFDLTSEKTLHPWSGPYTYSYPQSCFGSRICRDCRIAATSWVISCLYPNGRGKGAILIRRPQNFRIF